MNETTNQPECYYEGKPRREQLCDISRHLVYRNGRLFQVNYCDICGMESEVIDGKKNVAED
jgi:hypothetical protein